MLFSCYLLFSASLNLFCTGAIFMLPFIFKKLLTVLSPYSMFVFVLPNLFSLYKSKFDSLSEFIRLTSDGARIFQSRFSLTSSGVDATSSRPSTAFA